MASSAAVGRRPSRLTISRYSSSFRPRSRYGSSTSGVAAAFSTVSGMVLVIDPPGASGTPRCYPAAPPPRRAVGHVTSPRRRPTPPGQRRCERRGASGARQPRPLLALVQHLLVDGLAAAGALRALVLAGLRLARPLDARGDRGTHLLVPQPEGVHEVAGVGAQPHQQAVHVRRDSLGALAGEPAVDQVPREVLLD